MISAEFDNLEAMKRAVTGGHCLALLPPYVVQSEITQDILRRRPLCGNPLTRSLMFVWDDNRPFSPVTRGFLSELSVRYPALQQVLSH